MPVLDPSNAALMSLRIYDVKDAYTKRNFLDSFPNILGGADPSLNANPFSKKTSVTYPNEGLEAKTGGIVFKHKYLIGVVASGTGIYKNEAFVMLQGTSNLFDALTDLNTGVKHTSTAHMVHQGFEDAFRSLRTDLERFANTNMTNVVRVHCIGHSLGGGLATLSANYLANRGFETCLYTFGSPRVGLEPFSRFASLNIKPENIYRTYHTTDPVAMLPTWPFHHIAYNNLGYRIDHTLQLNPVAGHSMKTYVKSVENKTWKFLAHNEPERYRIPELKSWLRIDRPFHLMAQHFELISHCFRWIFSLAAKATGIALTIGIGSAATLLDRMALVLSLGAKKLGEAGIWLYLLVRKLARFVGIKLKEGTELTYCLLKQIFTLFHNRTKQFVMQIARSPDL